MSSIYDISNHSSSTNYLKDDIVKHGGRFWYALQDHSNQTPSVSSSYWGGNITAPNSTHPNAASITAPYFLWTPAYNMSVSHDPKVKSIKFGDGYEQVIKDGINNDLLTVSVNFEGRSVQEATAIIHFLESRQGKDIFFWRPPSPYNSLKKFICRQFQSAIAFQDNMNVSATFQETPRVN